MIRVKNALKEILKDIKVLGSEAVKLTRAQDRVLAEDIYSDSDIPGFDNSAMDGYAVKSADLKGASKDNGKVLEVVDDIKAGDAPGKILRPKQAIRIMTGALIPRGADSVVMVEDTREKEKNKVNIFKEAKIWDNIRKAGEDIKKGELVLSQGRRLNPAHIGILASLGRPSIKVVRRPKVAVLATGDEIVDVGERLGPGKVRSSNSYTLFSQVLKCGGIPKNLGIARDKLKQLEKKIRQGLNCDLILTSGGVSVGDYDLVKDVLLKIGTDIRFWKVAMRPGKPLVFGIIKGIPVFGLPGNPVSSMVVFEIFVRPAILKMLGQKHNDKKNEMEAVAEEGIQKKAGSRYFLRANTRWRQGMYFTKTTGPQGSGILKSMASANSLIILPEDKEFVKKGEKITVRFLD